MFRVYSTLTRRKEDLKPVQDGRVTIYTCGPTVYRSVHIGNMRSYLLADWLRRCLESSGYEVLHAKNITDVGHMRQEMLERGEDRVVAAALAEGKTPQQIASHYTEAFLADEARLNILPAHVFPRASENVGDMVALTEELLRKGFAYVREGNVYFDVGKFPEYGKLSRQQAAGLEEGARAETDPLKRDGRDFVLWKAAEPGRTLKWPSPWGDGFPGWHIECSAMARKYLGDCMDIHTGGVDNIFPHHEDEIAQSEAAIGQQHVRYWLHGEHLLVDSLKMSKSTRNTYTVGDVEARGFEPLAFRYLCATARYRSRLNFTWESLKAAQKGLTRLRAKLQEPAAAVAASDQDEAARLHSAFWAAARDDLHLPRALSITWKAARSSLPGQLKRQMLTEFDEVLGLDLANAAKTRPVPAGIEAMLAERGRLRRAADYPQADKLRADIVAAGFEVRDTSTGTEAVRIPAWVAGESLISSSGQVPSLLDHADEAEFTVAITAREGCKELLRCLEAVRRWLPEAAEVIVVDNRLDDECRQMLKERVGTDRNVRLFTADHFLGTAAAQNIALQQSLGRYIVFLDTSVEVSGDIFSRLRDLFDNPKVGVAGRWGVTTGDMRSFNEAESSGPVHAVEGYLMSFRREIVREVGLLDEKYRFYRHLDLDLSFAIRSRGYKAMAIVDLPVKRHEHIEWSRTPPEERERLSRKNFYRFLHRWGGRRDLLRLSG